MVLRNANKTREAQLFMQIYRDWKDPDRVSMENEIVRDWSWEDYDDFVAKYVSNREEYLKLSHVTAYYEGIGIMVHRKLVDPNLIENLMSSSIIETWEKLEPMIAEIRVRENYPQVVEWFEYLYDVIKPITEREHPEYRTNGIH